MSSAINVIAKKKEWEMPRWRVVDDAGVGLQVEACGMDKRGT